MLKHSHVGHDCVIGNNVTISCGAKVGGHTIVGDGCNIGLNAVIHQKQIIAKGCMIGMGAVVTRKLHTTHATKYAGNPAKEIGKNIF
jgi:UDP-N-acetylglucosamine acyltransferase